MQTLGLVDADGQLSLDVSDSVLLALQNAGIVDAEGNVIEQDISGQFLTTLQDVGLVDEEGNIIRPEAVDVEGGVISALQNIGLVDAEGQLSLDVSGDVLLALQDASIVDEDGNVIYQEGLATSRRHCRTSKGFCSSLALLLQKILLLLCLV